MWQPTQYLRSVLAGGLAGLALIVVNSAALARPASQTPDRKPLYIGVIQFAQGDDVSNYFRQALSPDLAAAIERGQPCYAVAWSPVAFGVVELKVDLDTGTAVAEFSGGGAGVRELKHHCGQSRTFKANVGLQFSGKITGSVRFETRVDFSGPNLEPPAPVTVSRSFNFTECKRGELFVKCPDSQGDWSPTNPLHLVGSVSLVSQNEAGGTFALIPTTRSVSGSIDAVYCGDNVSGCRQTALNKIPAWQYSQKCGDSAPSVTTCDPTNTSLTAEWFGQPALRWPASLNWLPNDRN